MNIKQSIRKKIIITTWAIIFLALYLFIFYLFPFNVTLRLQSNIFLGFVVGILLLPHIYKKKTQVNYFNLILGIVGIFATIFPTIIQSLITPNNYIIDNILDRNESYNIDTLFHKNGDENYIFAFDVTEYNDSLKSPTISDNKYLPELYRKYCKKAKLPIVEHNVKYREFCKAKLCYDLIRFTNYKMSGKFSIYVIGSEVNKIVDDWEFKMENVDNAIELIKSIKYDSKETHLDQFYQIIHDIVKKSKRERSCFAKNIIYIYSDFVLDKNKSIHAEVLDVNALKTGTFNKTGFKDLSIIENLFIIPHMKVDSKNEYLITNENLSDFERRTYVNDITMLEEFGNSIQNIKYKDFQIYYFENDESSSPKFEFSDSLYKVKIHKANSENSILKLINTTDTNKQITLSRTTSQTIKGKCYYAFKFGGSKEENPIIDISKDDLHVLIELKTNEEKGSKIFSKVAIVFMFTLLGIFIPYVISIIVTKINLKKIYDAI